MLQFRACSVPFVIKVGISLHRASCFTANIFVSKSFIIIYLRILHCESLIHSVWFYVKLHSDNFNNNMNLTLQHMTPYEVTKMFNI